MKRQIIFIAAAAFALLATHPAQGRKQKNEPAKPGVQNIILMVGDGMGLAQATTLMLAGDRRPVNIERATVGGFVKTWSANNRVTDSAAAATTYATGEKTDNGHLSVAPDGTPLETILEKAEKAGLATGLVATTHIMHATPGAFYSHTTDRNDYQGIALQLLDAGIEVAVGGGINYMTGRADGRDLVEEMRQRGYLMTDDLEDLDASAGGRAMVLYDEKAIPQYLRDGRDPELLARGTRKALEMITAASAGKGFFVMVEGSWIDSAGHANDAEMLAGELMDFDNAVGVAFDYADSHPGTLVIVVADHETGGLTIPSGKENFLLPDSGIEFRWSTGGHTATMVPLLAYGTGAANFGGILDNTEVNRLMVSLLGLQ